MFYIMSNFFNEGLSLYSSGDYEGAKESFLKVSEDNRYNALAKYYLGLIHVQTRKVKEAIQYYKQIKEIDLDGLGLIDNETFTYNLYINMGSALLAGKEFVEAARCFEEALQIKDWDNRVKLNLANTYMYMKQHEKAREILSELKDNAPEIKEVYYCLGLSFYETGEFQTAKEMFDLAVKKDDRAILPIIRLYETLLELNDKKRIAEVKKILIDRLGSEIELEHELERSRKTRASN